jgi:hypothetical protein
MSDRRARTDEAAARHYHVYVVKLDGAVLNHRRFREANPGHHPLKA